MTAGPDGLVKRYLAKPSEGDVFHGLFNVVTLSLKQPSVWRMNRTTLLPKEGKDPSKATSYRPITISSILSRLYWGVIDKRIRASTSLNARQKGFTPEMGCYNNINILNEVIATAKKTKGVVAIQVDIAKAFDTLPHAAIARALHNKGMPDEIVALVMDSYDNIDTCVKCQKDTFNIKIERGVKQGDPLSPLVFNLCMDQIIDKLESMRGFSIRGTNLSCLAFADDLVLLANTREDASLLLVDLDRFLIEGCLCRQVCGFPNRSHKG